MSIEACFNKKKVTQRWVIKVTKIDVEYQPPKSDHEYFEIIYDDFQKEGFERIGDAVVFLKKIHTVQVEMLGKQDQMLGKKDQMLEKQDEISEIRMKIGMSH